MHLTSSISSGNEWRLAHVLAISKSPVFIKTSSTSLGDDLVTLTMTLQSVNLSRLDV